MITNYNLDEFFKTKLPNYKTQAAFYTLIEAQSSIEMINPDQEIRFSSYLESGFGSWTGCSDLKEPFIELDEDVVEVRFEGEVDRTEDGWFEVEEFDED